MSSETKPTRSGIGGFFEGLSQGISHRFGKTRRESRSALGGTRRIRGVDPGSQRNYQQTQQEEAKTDSSYRVEENKFRGRQRKEAKRGFWGSTIKAAVGIAVIAGICRFAPDIGGAIANIRPTAAEWRISNGGEHGPMTTLGLLDGCKLIGENVADRNRVLNFYSSIEFTPGDNELQAKKGGMKEFFDKIQASDWRGFESFLEENWTNKNSESVPACSRAISQYEEHQQGKSQNGLQDLKDYVIKERKYSLEDIKKLNIIIEKVTK